MKIAVIGGGAAGFFAALAARQHNDSCQVTIFESGARFLKKVKISGGGRCNVTHNQTDTAKLAQNYPRGKSFLKKAFSQFAVKDTIAWFAQNGVGLKAEADGRMFPASDTSQTIVDCLLNGARKLGIKINKKSPVIDLANGFELTTSESTLNFDKVVIATGGGRKPGHYQLVSKLGHTIKSPVPSLFTFNIPRHKIIELQGLATPCEAKIEGSKFLTSGNVLVTHWGLSGPAILKLSALAARELAENDYHFKVRLKFLPGKKEDTLRSELQKLRDSNKKLHNTMQPGLPARLWHFLLEEATLDNNKPCNQLSNKDINRLIECLLYYVLPVSGKTAYKEEFVTCGGISLQEVDKHMQSKIVPGLYFAGEVLDIDGVTGGFNFQAAWTTGFIAGRAAATNS